MRWSPFAAAPDVEAADADAVQDAVLLGRMDIKIVLKKCRDGHPYVLPRGFRMQSVDVACENGFLLESFSVYE